MTRRTWRRRCTAAGSALAVLAMPTVLALVTAAPARGAVALAPPSATSLPEGQQGPAASDGEVFQIMKSVTARGSWTPYERGRVLSRPDLAASVVDPTSGRLVETVSDRQLVASRDTGSTNAVTAYATRQRTADRYIRYYSPTGGKVLDYHFVVTWNYNGSRVTSTPSRTHYVQSYTWAIYDRGLTSNSAVPKPGYYAYTVTLQALWEQCIAHYGCIAQDNPYSQFGVYFDGTYHLRQIR